MKRGPFPSYWPCADAAWDPGGLAVGDMVILNVGDEPEFRASDAYQTLGPGNHVARLSDIWMPESSGLASGTGAAVNLKFTLLGGTVFAVRSHAMLVHHNPLTVRPPAITTGALTFNKFETMEGWDDEED